ncbi:MAG TPA: PLP-dependent aminotransferase family protein [Longimicrobiales bacterium]|nr:PLP-dependent aminotransferase family protein [Longimicrobiales bacterium]
MTKQRSTLTLALPPKQPGIPAYLWLCDVLRSGILAGHLPPGTRLPATRDLARQYGLSRGTVVSAFAQLHAEGYTDPRTGSGTYVCSTIPEQLLKAGRSRARQEVEPRRRITSKFLTQIHPMRYYEQPSSRAFRANQPALDLFPTTLWAQVAGRRLRRASAFDLLSCGAMGYRPLQEAVADYLNTSRGVKCGPEQVAIVAGLQEAVYLAGRMFVNPGDSVCMEDPGYGGAARVFQALGAKIKPVPVDEQGMTVPNARLRNVRLVYVTPAHQYPLGITMSLARRMELLKWTRNNDTVILEDDYDSEYRYSGRPMPALQGLDVQGVVLFAGSFSKVMFPSLRLGYLVVPPDLVDGVAAIKGLTSRHAPVLEQAILADFISDGHFARHIRRMREVYAERLNALLVGAEKYVGELLEIPRVEAGLQTVGWLRPGVDAKSVARAAAKRDVEVIPLSEFCRGGKLRQGLQLGFAAVGPREIDRGLNELRKVLA